MSASPPTVSYRYDNPGRLIKDQGPATTFTYSYDAQLPPINDKASYGLSPLSSNNYHLSYLDFSVK
jgi:hypothetical protein